MVCMYISLGLDSKAEVVIRIFLSTTRSMLNFFSIYLDLNIAIHSFVMSFTP